MTDEIRNKIYNIGLVIEDVKKFPQTYKTILRELYDDGTCQFILRRKLNKLCKNGDIYRTSIPGTRFGQAIFYYLPKDYHILIEAGRTGSSVFCFFKFENKGRYYIQVDECWQLKKGAWHRLKEKVFFEGDVLKFI